MQGYSECVRTVRFQKLPIEIQAIFFLIVETKYIIVRYNRNPRKCLDIWEICSTFYFIFIYENIFYNVNYR